MARKSNITGISGDSFSIGKATLTATSAGLVLSIPGQSPVTLGEFSELGFSVRYSDETTPETTPQEGDSYIVATGATGAWAGHDDEIARWVSDTWIFFEPEEGWRVWDEEQDKTLVWTGTEWLHEIAQNVINEVLANDGSGSGIDADLLDGLEASQFLRSDVAGSVAGSVTATEFISQSIRSVGDLNISSSGNITHNIDTDNNSGTEKFSITVNGSTEILSASLAGLYVNGTAVATQLRTISTGAGLAGGGDLTADRTLSVDFSGLGTSTAPSDDSVIAFWDGTLRGREVSDFIADFNIVTSDNPLAVDAGTLDGLDSTAFARSTRTISTGAGLAGGGDLTADRTITLTKVGLDTTSPIVGSNLISFWTDNTTEKVRTATQFISDLRILTVDGSENLSGLNLSDDLVLRDGTDVVLEGTSILGKSSQPWSSSNISTIYVGDGTESTPSISFMSDTNTGFYRTGADSIGISTGAGQRVEINDDGIVVKGNITVEGTTTQIDSNTVNIGDNIIVLNSDETGSPSQDAGFEVERGTSGNVRFIWDETNDRFSTLTSNFYVGGSLTASSISVSGNINGRDIDAVYSKLDTIESGATADQTPSQLLTAIKTVDGDGSGLDADTVDGVHLAGLVQTSRTITVGDGLAGGGDLSTNRTIELDYSLLSPSSAVTGNDFIAFSDFSNSNAIKKRNLGAVLSDLNILTTANTGSGNGLDADTVDGIEASAFVQKTFSINTNNESGLGGGGVLDDDLNLYLDLNRLIVAVPASDDYLLFSDSNSSNDSRRATVSSFINSIGILTTADEGSGNGLDADTVDGVHSTQMLLTTGDKNFSGTFTAALNAGISFTSTDTGVWDLFGNSSGGVSLTANGSGGTEFEFKADGSNPNTAELRINGNKVWHAGNDGSSSGLDADTLDGVQGSFYTRTSRLVSTVSGSGLSGGGNLSADRSLSLSTNGVTSQNPSGTNEITFFDGTSLRKTTLSNLIDALDVAILSEASQNFTGDLIVDGNLTVRGTTTTISTTELNISDNIITLNGDVTSNPTENAGIEVERGLQTNARILWDEVSDKWKAGLSGSEYELLTSNSAVNATQLNGILSSQFIRSDIDDQMNATFTNVTDGSSQNIIIGNGTKQYELTAYTSDFRIGEVAGTQIRYNGTEWQIGDDDAWYDVFHAGNVGSGSGIDADTVDGVHLAGLVQTSRSISTDSGSGLFGGGDLSTNRSLRLSTIGIDATTSANTGSLLFFTNSATVKQRSIPQFISDNNIWTASNDGSGSGLDADTVDGIQGSAIVQNSRSISTGTGLSGGGDLTSDRTIELDIESLTSTTEIETDDSLAFYDDSSDQTIRRSVSNFFNDLGVITTSDTGSGNGLDADTVDGVHLAGLVQTSRSISTGTGLSGGGDLTSDRTIELDLNSLSSSESVALTDSIVTYDLSETVASRRTVSNFISDLGIWTASNDGSGSGLDADTVDGVHLAGLVQTSRSISTGIGLTGGGDLSTNRTIELDFSSLGSSTITLSDKLIFQDVSSSDIARAVIISDVIDDLGIARNNVDETFTGNVTVSGNLTVNGETTTINTTELSVEDPVITLSKNQTGTPTLDSGFRIERGDEPDALLIWDEASNGWKFGIEGNMKLLFAPGSEDVTNADTLDGLDSTDFVQITRTLSTGFGLSGGGDLSQNRTISLSNANLQEASASTADDLVFFDDDDNSVPKKRSVADFISDANILTTSNEGSGNNLDADTVDGLEASQFLRSDADDSTTGKIDISRNQSSFGDYSLRIDSSSNFASIRFDAGTYSASIGTRVDTWRHAFGNEDLSEVWWGYDGTDLLVNSGSIKVSNSGKVSQLGDDGNLELVKGSSGTPSSYIDFKGDASDDFDIRLLSKASGIDLVDSTETFASITNTGIVLGSGTAVTDGLYIKNSNTDANVWRIDDGSSNYGFSRKYNGSKGGNLNSLELYTDNQTGSSILVEDVLQDGRKGERTVRYNYARRETFSEDQYTAGTGSKFKISQQVSSGNPSGERLIIERTDELINSPATAIGSLFSGELTDGTGSFTGSVTDPIGGSSAATLELTSGTGYKREYETGITLDGSTQYTTSVLAKLTSGQKFVVQAYLGDADNDFEGVFDPATMLASDVSLGNGSLDDVELVEVNGGWYRCSITYTTSASPTSALDIRIGVRSDLTPQAVVSFAFPSTHKSTLSQAASFYADGQIVLPGRVKLGGEDRPADIAGSLDTVVVGDSSDAYSGIVIYSTDTGGLSFSDDGTIGAQISYDYSGSVMTLANGSTSFELTTTGLEAFASGGPKLAYVNASNTVPSVLPDKSDANTGIGTAAADALSLIAGGSEVARLTSSVLTANTPITISDTSHTLTVPRIQGNNTSSSMVLQPDGGEITVPYAANTRLHFSGDDNDWNFLRVGHSNGNDGFFFKYTGSETGVDNSLELWSENQSGADLRVFRVEQSGEIQFDGTVSLDGGITNSTSGSWSLADVVASGTVPSIIPNNADTNTGIGASAADTLSFVAGGIEAGKITSSGVLTINDGSGDGRIQTKHLDPLSGTDLFISNFTGSNVYVGSSGNAAVLRSSFMQPRDGSDSSYLGTDSNPYKKLVLDQGVVGTPSLTFGGDSNTGIYSPSADELAITLAGVQAARFAGDDLYITGTLYAYDKSFLIDHPTKPGKKLRHGSLEGPENGVYVRGRIPADGIIELPEYWEGLVDADSITVSTEPIGEYQKLFVKSFDNKKVVIGKSSLMKKRINAFYVVYGERKDVNKMEVER
jgi:hypothetical protein